MPDSADSAGSHHHHLIIGISLLQTHMHKAKAKAPLPSFVGVQCSKLKLVRVGAFIEFEEGG